MYMILNIKVILDSVADEEDHKMQLKASEKSSTVGGAFLWSKYQIIYLVSDVICLAAQNKESEFSQHALKANKPTVCLLVV